MNISLPGGDTRPCWFCSAQKPYGSWPASPTTLKSIEPDSPTSRESSLTPLWGSPHTPKEPVAEGLDVGVPTVADGVAVERGVPGAEGVPDSVGDWERVTPMVVDWVGNGDGDDASPCGVGEIGARA